MMSLRDKRRQKKMKNNQEKKNMSITSRVPD